MHSLFLGDITIYWIINLFLFAIILFCSYNISHLRNNQSFRLYALIIIVFYAIVEGLRWDRGADYYSYYLEISGVIERSNSEFLYNIIFEVWRNLHLPFWTFFVFCSGFFIASFLSLLRHFSKTAIWALPIFFVLTLDGSENLVRQYLGLSFFMLGYSAYLDNQKTKAYILMGATPLIHLSGIFIIGIFILFLNLKFNKKGRTNTLLYLIGFYLLLILFWDISRLSVVSDLIKMLPVSGRFAVYANNSDRWFTGEGSLALINNGRVGNPYHIFLKKWFGICLIYYGYKACKINKNVQVIFCMAYVSMLLYVVGEDIEMYRRLDHWVIFSIPILVGFILKYVPIRPKIKLCIALLVIMVYMFPWLSKIGTMPYSGCAFVWDLI